MQLQQDVSIQSGEHTLRGTVHIPAQNRADNQVPAVILFHGFTANRQEAHRMFLKLSRALEKQGIASFRFDFAGSGESDGDFSDMSVSSELRDAEAVLSYVQSLDVVNRNRIAVCGISLGGLIASLLAAERPQDIERLMLIAPAGNFKQIALSMIEATGGYNPRSVFDYGGNPIGPTFAEEILALDPYAKAAGYEGPVLLVHGTEDARVPISVSEHYVAHVYPANGRLERIEGANHTFDGLHWEQSLFEHLLSFMD